MSSRLVATRTSSRRARGNQGRPVPHVATSQDVAVAAAGNRSSTGDSRPVATRTCPGCPVGKLRDAQSPWWQPGMSSRPRGNQNVQSPRGNQGRPVPLAVTRQGQSPRGNQDVQSPAVTRTSSRPAGNQDVQSPRGNQDVQSPLALQPGRAVALVATQDVQSPRGNQNVQSPRGTRMCSPRAVIRTAIRN